MEQTKQLKTRQICLFFIAFMPVTKFFTMPSILALVAKNDLWVSALINILIDLLIIVFLLYVSRKTDKNYYQLLTDIFGKTTAKIICLFFALYFLIKSCIPIIEQRDYIDATLYISMPSIVYFIAFFIVAFYLATKKLRVLGRLADVLFLFTLSGYFLLVFLSLGHADFSAILPIGVNGAKNILSGSVNSFSWFGDGVYMIFFLGNFTLKKHDSLKIVGSYFINAFMTILLLIVFYGVFTSIAFRQRFALTEIAKYQTVISNTGRFDYLAIVSMLFSCIIALSIPLFFATKIIEQVFEVRQKYLVPLIVIGISFIFTWIFNQYYYSIKKFILGVISPIMMIFANIFPLVFALFCKGGSNEKIKR